MICFKSLVKKRCSRGYLFFLFVCAASFSLSGYAKEKDVSKGNHSKKIGEFGHWRAFTSQKNGQKICYMMSFPLKQEGEYKKRGKPHLMITHRPKDKNYNVVSVQSGYRFSRDHKPTLIITTGDHKEKFELFVEKESAWAPSDEIDQKITKMATKGESLVVKGESFKGTKITDTYSLKGSSAAYKAISRECNYSEKNTKSQIKSDT